MEALRAPTLVYNGSSYLERHLQNFIWLTSIVHLEILEISKM